MKNTISYLKRLDTKSECLKQRKVYYFHRIVKVQKHANRRIRSDIKCDTKNKRRLTDSLKIGELVLALAERLKEKDALGRLQKGAMENRPFLDKDEIFVIRNATRKMATPICI